MMTETEKIIMAIVLTTIIVGLAVGLGVGYGVKSECGKCPQSPSPNDVSAVYDHGDQLGLGDDFHDDDGNGSASASGSN